MRMDAAVKDYLSSTLKTPYFLFIGDEEYLSTINEFQVHGLTFLPMSSFCSSGDRQPDIDGLCNYIETADSDANKKEFVVTGLGEFLALRGRDEATSTLLRLKDFIIGNAKVILLLRGLAPLIAVMESDPRFDNRRHSIVKRAESNLSFTIAPPSIDLSALNGFKALLIALENGRNGNIAVNTAVNLSEAMFTVYQISNAYEGIKFLNHGFALGRACGEDEQWAELLSVLNQNDGSLDAVFDRYGLSDVLESDFYLRIGGKDFRSWLYYIFLKLKADTLRNGYLRFALEKTERFRDFARNVRNAIIDIPHDDTRFTTFYQERKSLIEKYPESDIADFVINNRLDESESIYKLTDGTKSEREEIIVWISKNRKIPHQLEKIYPLLSLYLRKYHFRCADLSDLLTDYFEAYKQQKLYNDLEPKFLETVDELAMSRQYNRLPTRNEILDSVEKEGTYLYWLDALGVEYLGLIEALAQRIGLSIHVEIARAELPTITSINRGFFDKWQGNKKEKNNELDNTKHNDDGGYNFTNNELPIHLEKELRIVSAMIEKAATKLASRECKRFLIVSDHGASRLAVLRRKEEKYDTDTSGEHSGRCCKLFQPYELPFAAEENGYLVLADYGRFKGSRAANVEVHGGASLEEVVIPVIELTLKDTKITVKLVDDKVTVDFRTGAEIGLFFNSPVQDVSVRLNGKPYNAVQIDKNHYSVKLPSIKRAGDYPAEVYVGDNLIDKVIIKAQGKSGNINDAFDDLF